MIEYEEHSEKSWWHVGKFMMEIDLTKKEKVADSEFGKNEEEVCNASFSSEEVND